MAISKKQGLPRRLLCKQTLNFISEHHVIGTILTRFAPEHWRNHTSGESTQNTSKC